MKIKIQRSFIIDDPDPPKRVFFDFRDLIGIQPVFFRICGKGRSVIPHCASIGGKPDEFLAILEHIVNNVAGKPVEGCIMMDIRILCRQMHPGKK